MLEPFFKKLGILIAGLLAIWFYSDGNSDFEKNNNNLRVW